MNGKNKQASERADMNFWKLFVFLLFLTFDENTFDRVQFMKELISAWTKNSCFNKILDILLNFWENEMKIAKETDVGKPREPYLSETELEEICPKAQTERNLAWFRRFLLEVSVKALEMPSESDGMLR